MRTLVIDGIKVKEPEEPKGKKAEPAKNKAVKPANKARKAASK